MRNLGLLFVAATALSGFTALAQPKCGDDICLGSLRTQVKIKGNVTVDRPIFPGTSGGNIVLDGGVVIVGTAKIGNQQATTAAPSDAGTVASHIEYGRGTLSGGTLDITFNRAFAFIPICTCSDTASSAAAANCNTPLTTGVTLKGGSSAVVNYICIGAR